MAEDAREGAEEADLDPMSGDTADERSVTSVPLDTDDGRQVVFTQQNVGPDNQVGGGEWKDAPLGRTPEEAAREQDELERRAPVDHERSEITAEER